MVICYHRPSKLLQALSDILRSSSCLERIKTKIRWWIRVDSPSSFSIFSDFSKFSTQDLGTCYSLLPEHTSDTQLCALPFSKASVTRAHTCMCTRRCVDINLLELRISLDVVPRWPKFFMLLKLVPIKSTVTNLFP